MKIKANAKINLVLNVLEKKEKYHIIDFIMAPISLYDEIEINFSEKDEVICEKINQEDNLVYKVLKEFKKKYKIKRNFRIKIKKNIPIGAGLAGGSSDCAFVLMALNQMLDLKLTKEELIEFSRGFGSDIAFFFINKIARVQGYGEKITSIDKKINKKIILINPLIELSTKKVYESHKLTNKHGDIKKFIESNNYQDYLHNDLEESAIKHEPIIQEIKNDLIKMNLKPIMSGSGCSVFAFFDNLDKSDYKFLEKKYPYVKIVEVL